MNTYEIHGFNKPFKTESELSSRVSKSMSRLRSATDSICKRCVHRGYGDECKDCFKFENNQALLTNFFPCPNWTRNEILGKMSDDEISTYMMIREINVKDSKPLDKIISLANGMLFDGENLKHSCTEIERICKDLKKGMA